MASPTECDRSVLRPCVRIEQDARRVGPLVDRVDDKLVLQAVVLREEIAATALERRRVLLVVPQRGELLADRFALRDPTEVVERDLVLGGHPVGNVLRRAHIRFQPAIGVSDFGAVVIVDLVALLRLRIVDRRRGSGEGNESDCGKQCGHGFAEVHGVCSFVCGVGGQSVCE